MSVISMEALDFRYLLLEHYKKIGLNEKEVMTILVIDHLLEQKNKFITADLLSLKMSISTSEIDKILVKLINRNFLEYITTSKSIKTSLEPLRKKLYEEFQKTLAKEQEINNSEHRNAILKNIYAIFEKELSRTLSPLEFSMINEWLNYGYSEEMIINGLKEALAKNKKSFRSIDKILLSWQARDDLEKEGFTAITDKWKENIEETIKIAQTKWIDDDDK
ncbi:MAG: DnaD domain protein [Bacilli bacterium]|jgi:DNA replication protein|nr:DnaD domain protein [Erysipelotrichia bacterium]